MRSLAQASIFYIDSSRFKQVSDILKHIDVADGVLTALGGHRWFGQAIMELVFEFCGCRDITLRMEYEENVSSHKK